MVFPKHSPTCCFSDWGVETGETETVTQTEKETCKHHPLHSVRSSDHTGKASGPKGQHFMVQLLKLIPQNENFLIFSLAPRQTSPNDPFPVLLEGFLDSEITRKSKGKNHHVFSLWRAICGKRATLTQIDLTMGLARTFDV